MNAIVWIILVLLVFAALTVYVIKAEREAAARRLELAPRVRNFGRAYFNVLADNSGVITAETLRDAIDLWEHTGHHTEMLEHLLENIAHIGHVTRTEVIPVRPIPGRGFPVGPILIRDYAISKEDFETWPSRVKKDK